MRKLASLSLTCMVLILASCWSLTTTMPDVFGGKPASGDAGADAHADAGRFCSTLGRQVKLCADFDEGDAETGWTNVDQLYGGHYSVDEDAHPGNGRCIALESPKDTDQSTAAFVHIASGALAEARVALDVRADLLQSGGAVVLVEFLCQFSETKSYSANLWLQGEQFALTIDSNEELVGDPGVPLYITGLTRAWTTVEFHVVIAGGPPSMDLTIGGQDAGTKQLALPANMPDTQTRLVVGLQNGPPTSLGPNRIFIDNVVYDLIRTR